MNTTQLIFFGLLHTTIVISLLSALVLWLQRDEGERAREVLALTWLSTACIFSFRLLLIYKGSSLLHGILPIESLLGGLAFIILLSLYPAEVIHPGWLNKRKIIIAFSPLFLFMMIFGLMKISGVTFHKINTLHEVSTYISEPDVWLRLAVGLTIYGYSFYFLCIPRNTKYANISRNWIISYCTAIQGTSILFGFNILIGIYPSGIFHLIYVLLFISYVTYQELYSRLFIAPSYPQKDVKRYIPEEKPSAPVIIEDGNPLWLQLETYMQQEEPWRNPDLTLPALAAAVCTNRTTLSTLIREHGFISFYDYLGYYRVEAFCQMANRKEVTTVQGAFFDVGFRSRAAAFNQFRKRTGVTPNDYIKKPPV